MDTFELIVYSIFTILTSFLFVIFSIKIFNNLFFGSEVSPNAKQDRTVQTDKLSFLQYNVKWRPSISRRGQNEFAIERAEMLANQIFPSRYDVICLNEAHSYIGSPVVHFIKLMKQRGFKYVKRLRPVSMMSFHLIDGGVLLLSKYPILDTEQICYELSVGGDMLIAKGLLYAKIQTGPGTHCHVFATHLQANHDNYLECKTVRFSQLYAFNSLRSRKAADGQPIVLIGDLNVNALLEEKGNSKLTEYQRLEKTIAMEPYTVTNCLYQSTGEHCITYGFPDEKILTPIENRNSKQCVDYVFLYSRDDGQYIIDGSNCSLQPFTVDGNKNFTQLSDHYGLECTVHFSLLLNDI